eukprot:38054-Eustigmatos_ZCMA.PRE.1
MQDAVKLLVDSFGRQMLDNVIIFYTRSLSTPPEEARKNTYEIRSLLAKRLAVGLHEVPEFPWFQYDAKPEVGARKYRASPEVVRELEAERDRAIDALLD